MQSSSEEIEQFVHDFTTEPKRREILMQDLSKRTNRVLINFPKYGIARKISNELKEHSFSEQYEFESTLSRNLHPLLSRLKLNLISDIILNKRFNQKYNRYRGDVSRVINRNKKLSMDLFRKSITEMAEKDGHYMVIKFCDLVLRTHDDGLAKTIRTIEVAINAIKRRLTDDEDRNKQRVRLIYDKFLEKHGPHMGNRFITRMEWDDLLRKYIPELQAIADSSPQVYAHESERGFDVTEEEHAEESSRVTDTSQSEVVEEERVDHDTDISQPEEKGEERADHGADDERIKKYAAAIKGGFLDRLQEDDEEGIRKIINEMISKNRAVPGTDGERITEKVIGIWLNDESISQEKRESLLRILHEQTKAYSTDLTNEEGYESADASAVQEEAMTVDADETDITERDQSDEGMMILSEDDLTELVSDEHLTPTGISHPDDEEVQEHTPDTVVEAAQLLEETLFTDDIESDELLTAEGIEDEAGLLLDEEPGGFEIPDEASAAESESERDIPEEESASGHFSIADEIDSGTESDLSAGIPGEEEAGESAAFEISSLPDEELGAFQIQERGEESGEIERLLREDEERNGTFAISVPSDEEYTVERTFRDSEIDSGAFQIQEEHSDEGATVERSIAPEKELNGSFTVAEKPESGNKQTLKEYIENRWEDLNRFKDAESEEVEEHIRKLQTIEDVEAKTERVILLSAQIGFGENRMRLYGELSDEDTFLIDLFNHLDQVARQLTIPETRAYVNHLISEFKDDDEIINRYPRLIVRLEVFRDRFPEDPDELMGELYRNLVEIEKSYPEDVKGRIEEQYRYLTECLDEERFASVKSTIITIIEKILSRDKGDYKRYLHLAEPEIEKVLKRVTLETGDDPVTAARNALLGKPSEEADRLLATLNASEKKNLDPGTLAGNEQVPEKLRSHFKIISDANGFEKAFNHITRSVHFSLETKIQMLDNWLRNYGEEQGWFDRDREKKLSRLNRMIAYYRKHLLIKKMRYEKDMGIQDTGEKPSSAAEKKAEPKGEEEKLSQAEDAEAEREERVLQQLQSIIRTFSDTIENAESLLYKLSSLSPEKNLTAITKIINKLKRDKKDIIDKTVHMIKSREPDQELITEVSKRSPLFQYVWYTSLSENSEGAKPEDLFKVFETDRSFYGEIKRILQIIRINNKNDLLKKSITREKRLLGIIEENLSTKALKDLWVKTESRQEKDRIRLFRDLLEIAGVSCIGDESASRESPGKGAEKTEESKTEIEAISKRDAEENRRAKKILEEIENFQKIYNAPRYRKLSEKRIPAINAFFHELAAGDRDAVYFVQQHRTTFITFLRYIINEHEELKSVFATAPAIKFCKENKLL